MSGNSVQDVIVTVETPLESIVQYDEEGRKLIFRVEPGEFPEIPEDWLLKLSKKNKDSYLVSKRLHADRMENAADEEVYEDIVVGENMGNARDRLNVEGLPEGLSHRWVRPDRVEHYRRRGWKVYEGKDVKTLDNKKTSGARTISNMGVREHYLMVIDNDLKEKHSKENREKREARTKSPENTAKKEFGSSAVDESKTTGVAFSTAVGSEDE